MEPVLDRSLWVADVRRPLAVRMQPIFRPYLGGDLRRRFRGQPSDGNDHWTDEWIGSEVVAGNADPNGSRQGLTSVRGTNGAEATLAQLVEAFPLELLGEAALERYGARLGFLAKLLSLGQDAPIHAHPDADFARQHLELDHGQAEAWIPLETRTADDEPLAAGVGFVSGAGREELQAAIDRRSSAMLRELIGPVTVQPGEAWLIRPGIPHWIGGEVLFIEVVEPSDISIVPEHWVLHADEMGATAGLGWSVGLGAFAFEADESDRAATPRLARQRPQVTYKRGQTEEVRLIEPGPAAPFDVRRAVVADELTISAGRFSVVVATAGAGVLVGEWGRLGFARGDVVVIPAAVDHRFVAGTAPLEIHRCMGPPTD